jgi:hypothetical protein
MHLNWFRMSAVAAVALMTACAAQPTPEWQANAHGALQRASRAFLEGAERVADAEWRTAQSELARTAQPHLVFRGALMRCAVEQSALQVHACTPDIASLRHAADADAAYTRYLAAAHLPADVPLLPEAHQAVASALLAGIAPNLLAVSEPLSRLVAASVVLQKQGVDAALLQTAVDTASAQGWRKPLLAWLRLQLLHAQQQGDTALAQKAEHRMAVLLNP